MLNIFLCDFVHNFIGAYTYMFPLNIGYISAFAKKEFNNKVNVRLFKFPNDFLDAVSKQKPDIAGFSSYMWNANLNKQLMSFIKSYDIVWFWIFYFRHFVCRF